MAEGVMRASARRPALRVNPRVREALDGYLALVPTVLIFGVFVVFPVVFSLWMSFHRWTMFGQPTWIGLQNYSNLLQDPDFAQAIINTLYFTVVSVPLGMIVALALALILTRKMRGVTFYRTVYFAPVVTSTVAVALVWQILFNGQYGLVNYLLSLAHLPTADWLQDPRWAMPSIILLSVWKGLGYNMVIFLAGLQGIPEHYYEAAKIDGAGATSLFRHITLPLLFPTTFFILVVSIIGSFQVFDQVYILSSSTPASATNVIVLLLYQHAFQSFQMGYASAMAWVLFLMIFIVSIFQFRFLRRFNYYEN
jgi:multiple sugar transport system permease protein